MKYLSLIAVFGLLASTGLSADEDVAPVIEKDPHRNEMGFFDVHICNWPDRQMFFKSLFSTTKFKDIKSMEVFFPDGNKLTDLNMKRFKKITKKGKPEKRVYMVDMDVPAGSMEGWYYIVVKTKQGKEYRAKDFVSMSRIGRADGMVPLDEAEDIKMPTELKWKPVPGASHYKVFIRDGFENTLVLKSRLITEPRLALKPGTLQPGGYYIWKVHARDVNENYILGDFHAGSINKPVSFTIVDE